MPRFRGLALNNKTSTGRNGRNAVVKVKLPNVTDSDSNQLKGSDVETKVDVSDAERRTPVRIEKTTHPTGKIVKHGNDNSVFDISFSE